MNNNVGVAVTKCFICGGDNEIIMNRRLTKRRAQAVEEMHGKVVSTIPCPSCAKQMETHIALIETRDGDTSENPYRTGRLAFVEQDAFLKILSDEIKVEVMERKMCYIPETAWSKIMPKENDETAQ